MRLKSRLTSNGRPKRAREDDEEAKKQSSDEEDSRAGAIQKRAKLDVFDAIGTKKRRRDEIDTLSTPQMSPGPSSSKQASEGTITTEMDVSEDTQLTSSNVSVTSPSHPSGRKKKRRHKKLTNALSNIPTDPLLTPSSSFDHGGPLIEGLVSLHVAERREDGSFAFPSTPKGTLIIFLM
jgi:hypothetical protein